MALSEAHIIRLNPWWTDSSWRERDPHLASLTRAPVRLPAPEFVAAINLERPAIHTVRGPRQVGKSTGLKLLAERALDRSADTRSLVYLSLDLLVDQPIAELAATIVRAKELAAAGPSVLLLLDEVTVVARWAEATKALWDDGTIRNDIVVCTGSSAVELASQVVERLPGRRGAGRDFLVLPQSFASFARCLEPGVPTPPGLSLGDLFLPDGQQHIRAARALQPRLDQALRRYLLFGGLPLAVAEAAGGAREPSPETRRVLWDSIEREVTGGGTSRASLVALLERIARSLGSKTNWSTLGREMDIPLGGRRTRADYRSVRDYVDHLARAYFLLVVYFWKSGSDSRDLSKDKKIYFGDPLLHTLTREHAPGLPFDQASAVENAVALSLYRRYEPIEQQAEGYTAPEGLHVWETSRPNEIDFVCGPRTALEMIEVKYRKNVGAADTLVMRRALPGRPAVLATQNSLRLEKDQAWIPASLLLWALG